MPPASTVTDLLSHWAIGAFFTHEDLVIFLLYRSIKSLAGYYRASVILPQQNSIVLFNNPWVLPAIPHQPAFAHAVLSVWNTLILTCWHFTHFQISAPLPPNLWRPGGRRQWAGRVGLSRGSKITASLTRTKSRHTELNQWQSLHITSRLQLRPDSGDLHLCQ